MSWSVSENNVKVEKLEDTVRRMELKEDQKSPSHEKELFVAKEMAYTAIANLNVISNKVLDVTISLSGYDSIINDTTIVMQHVGVYLSINNEN